MIAIVDYGMGNRRSVEKALEHVGTRPVLTSDPDTLRGADGLVLPGVGAFDHAMELLQQSGMREALDELVLSRRLPVLGICVGMQILANGSDEGQLSGLGWIEGLHFTCAA